MFFPRSLPVLAFVFGIVSTANAIPSGQAFQIFNRANQINDTYDYVIVGGGTSGLTVGDRLSESGKYSVLVIEYGILDNNPDILSGGVYKAMDPTRQFDIPSVPQAELNNRSINVRVGKAVGGSSTINGMQLFRGTSAEYDMWSELGAEDSTWNWAGLLPYFKKSVHFVPPLDALAKEFNITYDVKAAWGQDLSNNLYAGYPNYQPPEIKYMYDAMSKTPNVPIPRDGNAGSNGLFWWPNTMNPRTYTRSYARTGHWDNISRSNYHLLTGAKVTKILLNGQVTVGVSFLSVNGSEFGRARALKEVILAAGAIHTPQILQLSGIGPKDLLRRAGVPVKVDLPGVGANFQDHGYIPAVAFKWTITPPVPVTNSGGDPKTMLSLNIGALLGLPAISPGSVDALAAIYEKQRSSKYLPKNTHPDVLAGYDAQKKTFTRILRWKNVSMLWQILQTSPSASAIFQHPVSRGTVNIDPLNLTSEPIVDYRALSNPWDLDIMVELVHFIRRFFTSGAFAPYGPIQTSPGPNVTTDPQLRAWIKEKYIPSVYHPVGTASLMRRELGGVVNEDLLVYGVQRLSVVDASVIPIIPGCPTTLTVYAIAEKASHPCLILCWYSNELQAADLIKARQ
ncbi:related to alcohol oxidase [Rhynchosporium graminicola]|uniref:Related to alcohol oxidase n=1 Tax=Rhynchosporium graminicola TaxID=2792576 RepID=A0A1E1JZK0_9HELO|nr:related to alcohol oxidase [Rhynchosporium commune]